MWIGKILNTIFTLRKPFKENKKTPIFFIFDIVTVFISKISDVIFDRLWYFKYGIIILNSY